MARDLLLVNILHKLMYHDTTVNSADFIFYPVTGNAEMTGIIINLVASNEFLLIMGLMSLHDLTV